MWARQYANGSEVICVFGMVGKARIESGEDFSVFSLSHAESHAVNGHGQNSSRLSLLGQALGHSK